MAFSKARPRWQSKLRPSPNTAAQLDLKMELYFAHGAEEVWIIYPKTSRVRAHFPDRHSETLATELRSALFPGWSAALSAVFTE